MSNRLSPEPGATRALRFACSCASAAPVADDPWVAIAKQGKLNDGTKELILNALHRQPRTIAQLAQLLGLSPPAVHRHITELLNSELIREVPVPPTQRRSPVERHYRPNFPVVRASDRRELQPVLEELASMIAEVFRAGQGSIATAIDRTGLLARGESVDALLHYLYTEAVRTARSRLEAEGALPPWPEHQDGSHWMWWAEEPPETEVQ
jgi:DNA-binding transcriptional ArsR family regulator